MFRVELGLNWVRVIWDRVRDGLGLVLELESGLGLLGLGSVPQPSAVPLFGPWEPMFTSGI